MERDDGDQTYDLRGAVDAIRRRALLVVVLTAIGAGVGIVAAALEPTRYLATASLLIRETSLADPLAESPAVINGTAGLQPLAQLQLLELDQVAEEAADRLPEFSEAEVADAMTFESGGEPELIAVTASTDDPEEAAQLANTVSEAFVDLRREADVRVITTAIESVEEELANAKPGSAEAAALRRKLTLLRPRAALQGGDVEIAEVADPPTSSTTTGVARGGIVGGVAGLVIGLIAALVLARLRPRLESRRALEQAYPSTFVAEIGDESKLLSASAPELSEADREQLRALWTRLRFADPDAPTRSVVVSSARPRAGVSAVSAGLAKVTAAEGVETLLVDANLRRPALAEALGADPEPGLTEYLAEEVHDLDRLIQPIPGSGPAGEGESLGLLAAGRRPANPTGLFGDVRGTELVEEIGNRPGLVVFDVPALGAIADGLPLLRQVDGAILVDRPGHTWEEAAEALTRELDDLGVALYGLVVVEAASSVARR